MNDWMDNGRIETRVREREKMGGGRTLRENGYIPFDEQLVEGTRFFRIFANDFW